MIKQITQKSDLSIKSAFAEKMHIDPRFLFLVLGFAM